MHLIYFRPRYVAEVSSPTVFRREMIPLHASMMAENPHYETPRSSSSNSESKEDCDKVSSMPLLVLNRKPDYRVISSSCLHPVKELGEGVFGKVHLADYCSSEEPEAEKFLVAVSIEDP